MKKHDAKAYRRGHEDGYETGYEHGRKACRMTDSNRRLLYAALDTLREGQGATMDQIVLEVMDYVKKS